ncbi:tyrosine/phenylalanine carboxypeptidase domain-containing protein, partial [Zeaxanthinibacter enoshimensis]|uniref:tyrosine/phenylalanine carboxypeptidase domain-containing protein n=1 Tax=Zeaxanthinibacter enoshimensis TaxID=392009 RepID=UPI0035675A7C
FNITLRAHRGGGFTKDRLYLSGLRKIYKRYSRQESLDILLSGKVAIDFENDIAYLQARGLAAKNTFDNLAFRQNLNKNSKLDFILNNLK